MHRPIAISLSPNAQVDDVILALKLILKPWTWFDDEKVEKLENCFSSIFGKGYYALSVNSGRSAWFLILKALELGKNDQVAIQAFTCIAVPNSINWLGARPLFIDIDDSYNLNPRDLSKKLNKRVKIIVVQNTFGIPANYKLIKKIARENNLILVEDCAHCLGGKYNGSLLGTLGDVSFFSFGRDKVISSVFGGMILCKNKSLYLKLRKMRDELKRPSYFWVLQQLLHPVFFALILPFYNFGVGKLTIGKILLFLLQKLGILSFPLYFDEKLGKKPEVFPQKMPGALAILVLNQLKKLEDFNTKRKKIAKFYFENLKNYYVDLPVTRGDSVWLRFPLRLERAKLLYEEAKKKGILLGNWYTGVVQPTLNLSSFGYKLGSCPKAERVSSEIINLPTYPTLSLNQARKVVDLIKLWLNSK